MITARQSRGQVNYHAGLAAEDSIAADYIRRGHEVLARRWRGRGGEIDLVTRKGDLLSFVEIKKARCLARAAESLRASQMRRIAIAAEEFLALQPLGNLTECRFDVGLVDGQGNSEVIENAFMLH